MNTFTLYVSGQKRAFAAFDAFYADSSNESMSMYRCPVAGDWHVIKVSSASATVQSLRHQLVMIMDPVHYYVLEQP